VGVGGAGVRGGVFFSALKLSFRLQLSPFSSSLL